MTGSRSPARVTALRWGVKQSFRAYVAAMGGQIELGGEAARTEDGEFVWPAAPDSSLVIEENGALRGVGRFRGRIGFQAHGGMLSVEISDPILRLETGEGILTVAGAGPNDRVEIARIDLSSHDLPHGGTLTAPAVITRDGGELLGGHYPAMTPVDPVVLVAAAEGS